MLSSSAARRETPGDRRARSSAYPGKRRGPRGGVERVYDRGGEREVMYYRQK